MRHHVALLATVAGLACRPAPRNPGPGDDSPNKQAPTITITANDFAFGAPDTAWSGYAQLEFVNAGRLLHHAMLLRVDGGHTLQDVFQVLSSLRPGKRYPAWLTEAGGLNPPDVADTARATLRLDPGRYAIVCFIDIPDEVPHFMKGMMRELIVQPSPASEGEPPRHDARMALREYDFDIQPALTAGPQVLRVENVGTQPHEFALVQLAPGKHLAHLDLWMAGGFRGDMPGRLLSGAGGLSPGGVMWVHLDLQPGQYALLCFTPDANDGKPHRRHGMVREITVH
jgi:hypothetical protein